MIELSMYMLYYENIENNRLQILWQPMKAYTVKGEKS